jgi:hypothetical protein
VRIQSFKLFFLFIKVCCMVGSGSNHTLKKTPARVIIKPLNLKAFFCYARSIKKRQFYEKVTIFYSLFSGTRNYASQGAAKRRA